MREKEKRQGGSPRKCSVGNEEKKVCFQEGVVVTWVGGCWDVRQGGRRTSRGTGDSYSDLDTTEQ